MNPYRRRLCTALIAAVPWPLRAAAPPLPTAAPEFALQDHKGRTRRLADFRGKVVVLFFGYAQCPDVCPTTMATLAQVMQQLGPLADKVQVVFVTVDPERDTPVIVNAYATAFDPRFLGLRGSAAATRRAADAFGAEYQRKKGPTPTSYTVDHTAGAYLIDPAGVPRIFVAHGARPEVFERDLRRLLAMLPD